MNNICKRILCCVLSFLLVLTLVPLSASAEGQISDSSASADGLASGTEAVSSDGMDQPGAQLPQDDVSSQGEDVPLEENTPPEEGPLPEESTPPEEDPLPEESTPPEEDSLPEESTPSEESTPAEPSEELLALQELMAGLPSSDEIASMSGEELDQLGGLISQILDIYDALSEEEQALVDLSPLEALSAAMDAQPLADAYKPVSLSVTYTTEELPNNGGLKYKFTFTSSNGNGPFKYRAGSIMAKHSSGTYMEYDRTRGSEQYYTDATTDRTYSFEYTFKASGTYYFDAYVMDMGVSPLENPRLRVEIEINNSNYPSIDQKIDEILQACAAENIQTDYDKVLFFHDWLIDHTEYDHDLRYASPAGVLCYGKGTCESYFGALDILLNRSGIPHDRITNADHVWTLVQLNGEWTMVDATWDDVPEPFLQHMYFGITDDLIKLSHGKYSNIKFVPGKSCTDLDQHYMIRSGEITQISDPIKAQIKDHAPGSFTVDIRKAGVMLSKSYPIPFHIAAYYLVNCDSELKGTGIEVTYNSADHSYSVLKPCNNNSHTPEIIQAVPASCSATGLTEGQKCSVCGTVTVQQEIIPALPHTSEIIPAVAPTCTTTGLTEGEKCSVCGTVTVDQKTIPALGHNPTVIPAVPATCTEAGLTEGKTCSVCGVVTVPQKTVSALGHKLVTLPAVAATCTKIGLTKGEECSVCHKVTVAQETVPALGHKPISIPAVAPTCSKTGLTEGKKCSVCGEITTPQKTVPVIPHKTVPIPGTPAICTRTGRTEGEKCSVCGKITTPQQTIPVSSHKTVPIPGTPATCTKTGLTEGQKCSVCGKITVPQKTISVTSHTPVTDPAVEPSGFDPGLTEGSHCGLCGKTLVAQKEYFSKTALFLPSDGLSGKALWVDGVQLPAGAVTEKDGKICIELSRTDASSLVTYTYNKSSSDPHEVYPVGMKVWMLQYNDGYTAKYIPEFDDLLKYAGSSIRISGVKGIRMITGIRQNVKNALTGSGIGGYTLREYGTVLAWASEVDGSSLVLGAPGAKSNFAYKRGVADPVFSSGGGMIQYTNVLVGFNNDQCKADIVMRPYIVLRDSNGRDITVYGGVVQRSIGYIAYQNRAVFSRGSSAYNYVWEIIHHVYGSKYD